MEERTVQPKKQNAKNILWRDTMQRCATQRKLSKDWKKKRMSYWVSSQRLNPEREWNGEGTTSVNSLELQDPWHANIQVNGKKINFRVDTRADVTVIQSRYFTKNSPLILKTNKKLSGPEKAKINVVSQFQATLTTEHTKTKQTLFVVGNLQEPLLGRPATEALHLL